MAKEQIIPMIDVDIDKVTLLTNSLRTFEESFKFSKLIEAIAGKAKLIPIKVPKIPRIKGRKYNLLCALFTCWA